MSVQTKVIWLVTIAILVFGAIDIGTQWLIIQPSFTALEEEEALKNMDRAVEAINREIRQLDATATDWAFWDDTYQFAQDQNTTFVESNLHDFTLEELGVNLFYIFNADQELIWGMVYDLESQEEITDLDLVERLGSISLAEIEASAGGVLLTDLDPILISARPILTTDHEGPIQGTMVFGKFLDTVAIGEQARIVLNAMALDPQNMDPKTRALLAEAEDLGGTLIRKTPDENHVYQALTDLDNEPALLLRVDVPRDITTRGDRSLAFAMISLIGTGLVVLLVLINGLRRIILKPLKQLTDHTVATGQNDKEYKPLALERSDEIGTLSQEFDRTIEHLATARKSLMEQSYHSGKAEVASAVLHNVGNILNSVNVSCALLMDQLRDSRVGNVAKLAEMVAQPEGGLSHYLTEDPKGRQIPSYLASLAAALEKEQQAMVKETASLQGQVARINEIVAMQQSYSRASQVIETVSAEELMEDAIRISAEDLTRLEVRLVREFQPMPPIEVDKHKVLQILLNLISNAKHACADNESKDRIITLRIFPSGDDRLSMQVADNGIGIPPENMPRIFQSGFTTRKNGHGLGLHNSSLAAHELNGSLTVMSDGPGKGATFTLELPYHPKEKK